MTVICPVSYPDNTYTYSVKRDKKPNSVKRTNNTGTDYSPAYYKTFSSKENLLENYDYAKEYFSNNYNRNKPLFGKPEDIKLVESNENVKRNFCKFLVEKSDEEIIKLCKKKCLNHEELEKIEGFRQINEFFKEYLELIPEKKVSAPSFSGTMTREDETSCKNFVHIIAGACSLISAGAGAFNCGSGDAMFLRGIQMFMFLNMQQYLKVPLIAATEYTAKELFSGAVIGIEGAKILTDIAGGGAHALSLASGASTLSGGSTHAAISGTQAAIHGSLSFLITEKMGRGFIKRVKSNRMTFKDQSIELGQYALVKWIFGGGFLDIFDIDSMPTIENAHSAEAIKDAYEAIPDGTKEFMGSFADLLKNFDEKKLGISFAFNFVANYLSSIFSNKNKNPKEILAKSFKDAFIMTAVYDMYDYAVGEAISSAAQETVEDLQKNLEQYPEAFRIFKNSEAEFYEHIDLDKLDTEEFQNQFKNRTFLAFISSMTNSQIKDFVKACKVRKNKQHTREMQNCNEEYDKQIALSKEKNNRIDKKSLEEILNRINAEQKNLMILKNDFGYGRIGGYNSNKEFLTLQFVNPVAMEKSTPDIYPPVAMLFYGPTSTGKTTLAIALAEQSKCGLKSLPLFLSDEKLAKQIDDIKKSAIERFETKKQRTIIQIDEIEGLSKKPKSLEKITGIIENEDSRITIIGTTNSPKLIDPKFAKHFMKLYIGPATKNDIHDILDKYLDKEHKTNIDTISTALSFNKTGKYSNRQIENIAYTINTKDLKDINQINNYIKSVKPEIKNNELRKYKEV